MQLKHTHKKICAGFEEGAVTDWRCQKWFSEFCAGDFSLDDIPQSSRPVKLTAVKHNNGEQWMLHQQETADILKISKSSTEKHLQQLGYVEVKWKSFTRVCLFVTPGTIACQAPQSMGILQARILEWVAIPFSRGSSVPRDQTQVSCNVSGFFTIWALLLLLLSSFSRVQLCGTP